MKRQYPIIILILFLLPGCQPVSPGSTGGPPINEKISLTANQETTVKDTKLILTLKEVAPGPPVTAAVNARLNTMEIQRVLKIGDSFELGEFKVTVTAIGTPEKPVAEVQAIRQ